MLISKTVEVLLSGTNIEYFENKDYKIPRRVDKQGRTNVKRGTKITVRTEDLPDNSDVLVAVQCDLSGIVYDNIKWYTYKKHVKEDGKYYHKIYTEKKKNKKRYVRGLSFYDWCYKYLSKKLADWIISRWDYELNVDRDGNSVSPKDVGRGSDGFNKDKRGYWFKCLDHPEHGSELKNIGRFTNNFKGFMGSIECIQCNCIALTHPHLVRYLVNKEDGYKYSMGSSEYVFIKCPDCGFEKEIRLTDLVRYNFSCKICSDQIPYSEKFTANLLRQLLKQDFIIQLTRKYKKWCGKYKYDFYTNTDNINCIIETHGQQHYDQTSGKWGTLEEIQQNDKDKEELAKSNNIENYIVIDCRKSELEWIKHNIMNRDPNRLDQPCLAEVLNFKEQDINWLKCHEFACSNLIKEVCSLWSSGIHDILTISEKVKIGDQTIRKYLKQGAELGWCDYKLTIKMKVICVTTGEIFESQAEATKKYKTKTGSISDCCKGVRKTTGILSDGSKLIWMYYEDYILKTEEEIENMIINKLTERKIFNKKEGSTRRISKVICLSTKEIFNTMTEAATKYNIPYTTISSCCRKLTFSAGKDLITGCPLVWMYYNEYILKTDMLEQTQLFWGK